MGFFPEIDFNEIVNEEQPKNFSIYLQENHTYEELIEMLGFFQCFKNMSKELTDYFELELVK